MNLYEKALKKIEKDEKCKPKCVGIIGPTGPHCRLHKSSNKIIHNFKQFPIKCI